MSVAHLPSCCGNRAPAGSLVRAWESPWGVLAGLRGPWPDRKRRRDAGVLVIRASQKQGSRVAKGEGQWDRVSGDGVSGTVSGGQSQWGQGQGNSIRGTGSVGTGSGGPGSTMSSPRWASDPWQSHCKLSPASSSVPDGQRGGFGAAGPGQSQLGSQHQMQVGSETPL